MRAVLQRVGEASVRVEDEVVGAIAQGLLVLLGIADGDDEDAAAQLAGKVARLRIFADERGRMNRSLREVGGNALVVSQFTLLGSTRKGNRPSFAAAAPPAAAERLYEYFCARLGEELGQAVERGRFGAHMAVALVNDGPVTLLLEQGAQAPGSPA